MVRVRAVKNPVDTFFGGVAPLGAAGEGLFGGSGDLDTSGAPALDPEAPGAADGEATEDGGVPLLEPGADPPCGAAGGGGDAEAGVGAGEGEAGLVEGEVPLADAAIAGAPGAGPTWGDAGEDAEGIEP